MYPLLHAFLLARLRPQHYKPDIIRAVGYLVDPVTKKLVPDPSYTGRRALQIIECKYSTDLNMDEIMNLILELYTPLKKQDPRTRGRGVDLRHRYHSHSNQQNRLVPHFHRKALAHLSHLISFKEEPPDELTYKALSRESQAIAMDLVHTHAQSWLTLMSKVSTQMLSPSRSSSR